MDTVAAFPQRRSGPLTDTPATSTADVGRALGVTATYVLSEEGRKASLLAGDDGRAIQQLTVQVPANRLHLVSVDANGVARLKLRPRYQLDGDQSIIRVDSAPTYDAPPDIEELFREAARNHQLERTYQAERRTARSTRRETEREFRAQVAQAFLGEPTQRALVHPAPTPKRCYLATDRGRVLFDASTDEVPARDVPAEAHRRFRADLRVRHDLNQQDRAAQLALHEEKKRFIAEWIAAHGTPEQQARHTAGMLPMEESLQAMTDEAFAVLEDRPRYTRDGISRLQAHWERFPEYAQEIVTARELIVTSANAVKATAAQWALVGQLQSLLPDATFTLRVHKVSCKRASQAPSLTLFGVLVTRKVGPFTLRREYAAPEEDSHP